MAAPLRSQRPTPFSLVFGALAPERFPALRDGIAAAGRDACVRDAFLLVPEVAELLQELRPEDELGHAVEGLVAFVRHAYLFWLEGERVIAVDEAELARLLSIAPPPYRPSRLTVLQSSRYLQLAPLRIWGVPIPGAPPEPLDGWFARRGESGTLEALAIFGLHPGREGFTAVEVSGPRPESRLVRPDGSVLFSPTLAGGAAAGLASVDGEEELLELAWRGEDFG